MVVHPSQRGKRLGESYVTRLIQQVALLWLPLQLTQAPVAACLRLIAAAGVEGFISCWDYQQPGGKLFDFCMGHTMDTTALAFLEPYPLLSSCDSSGNVAIWIVPPFSPSTMQYVRCYSRAAVASAAEC